MDGESPDQPPQDEPTPISDALQKWALRGQTRVFAEIAFVSMLVMILADFLEIMWLTAMTGVFFLAFGSVALLGYTWRSFKKWRYPSYYEVDGDA